MKKFLFTLFVCIALASVSTAQDPNFSQFFASPLTLNPALTGKFDGVYRFAANYRNQWPTISNAYTTMTASIDMGIMKTGCLISINLAWVSWPTAIKPAMAH
jgi:hypothetical protein